MELMALLILTPPFLMGLILGYIEASFAFFSRTPSIHLYLCPMTQGHPLCFDSPPLEETILSMPFLDV